VGIVLLRTKATELSYILKLLIDVIVFEANILKPNELIKNMLRISSRVIIEYKYI
jgi:hypothetical protein